MADDFALIDFAVMAAPPERVLRGLAQVHALRGRQGAAPVRRPGLVARLLGRGADTPPGAALRLQPAGSLPPAPIARADIDAPGFGQGDATFRVSTPIGAYGMVMVEFREDDDDTTRLCSGLSAELPGAEIFRFRLSGLRHPGSDTAFHVYLDGRAIRRTASVSEAGTAPEAPWRVVDAGMPHAVEADSLPGARARAWEVMTPPRQAAILAALGIDAERLFEPDPARRIAVLSPDPAGRPLGEATALFDAPPGLRQPPALVAAARRAGPDAPPNGGSGTGMATGDREGAGPGPLAGEDRGDGPGNRARHGAATGTGRAGDMDVQGTAGLPPPRTEAPGASRTGISTGASSGVQTPSDVDLPRAATEAAGNEDATAWEEEVTALLVAAVAHALPAENQVRWLTHLTARMEAGEIDAALEEARDLLRRGDRPEADRAADIARLDALFRDGAG